MEYTYTMNKVMLLVVGVLLLLILYPTSLDTRSTIYDYTKWGVDSLGLMAGYLALIFSIGLLPISGGQTRRGLIWFAIGMFIMGSSFFFGPIINHYHLIKPDYVEGLHGVGMLGGMIAYLVATYSFMRVFEAKPTLRRYFIYYLITFLVFMSLYISTMFVDRSFGNTVKYWTELASFGLGGVMILMSLLAHRRIASGYLMAMNLLLISSIFVTLSYPFGPIGQPTKLWTGAQGGTLHHGIMAISIILFLVTVLYLRRLEVYTSSSALERNRT